MPPERNRWPGLANPPTAPRFAAGGSARALASAMPPAPWQLLARLAAAPLLLRRARCAAAGASGPGGPLGGGCLALLAVAGDGACMFRSLAQGAHLAEQAERAAPGPPRPLPPAEEGAAAAAVRAAVCDELAAREAEIGAFIEEDFGAYVARMRQPATWGGMYADNMGERGGWRALVGWLVQRVHQQAAALYRVSGWM